MSSLNSWSQVGTPAPIRLERYHGTDENDTFNKFGADARLAARAGYEAVSHSWETDTLVVQYRFRGTPGTRRSRLAGISIPGFGVMLGGAIVAFGAILPWVVATDASGLSRLGTDGPDGLVAILFGLSLAVVGRTMVRGQNSHRATWSLASSVLTVVFIFADYVQITAAGTPGIGLLVCSTGAVIAAVASLRIRLTASHAVVAG